MKKDTDNYYAQCHAWSDDVYSHAIVWRNWALVITIISLLIAVVSVFALYKVFPLKENIPFLVFVDNQKGQPVMIRPITSDDFIENDHLKTYMIRKFIIARERFDAHTQSEDAQIVSALAVPEVYTQYQEYVSHSNAHSLINKYKNSTIDVGEIKISFLNPQRAYVSFTLLIKQEGIIQEVNVHAQIKFQFAQQEITLEEAHVINPVNFEVLTYQSHYQMNQEVVL